MHRVAIAVIMLMQGIYEMEGSQRTNIKEDGEMCMIGQDIPCSDPVSFQVTVQFGTTTERTPLHIEFTNGRGYLLPPLPPSMAPLVTKGAESMTFIIDVDFEENDNGKWILCRFPLTKQNCALNLDPLTFDNFRLDIAILEGLLQGDTVEITGIHTQTGEPVVPLPPSDEPKRGKKETSDVSNRGDDQGKDGDDNQNAPSSDVSKSGPSMIAAIVVAIVTLLMN